MTRIDTKAAPIFVAALLVSSIASFAQEPIEVLDRGSSRALYAAIPQDLGVSRSLLRETGAVVSDVSAQRVGMSRTWIATWAETSGSVVSRYSSASTDGGVTWFEARPTDYDLRLHVGRFDPLVAEPTPAADLAASPTSRLRIVQYVAPGLPAMRDRVAAAGAEILFYLPNHADVVSIAPEAVDAVRALPFVRWVGAFHPAYKMFPEDLSALLRGATLEGAPWNVVAIRNHDLATKERAAAALSAFGAEPFLPIVAETRLFTLSMTSTALLQALRNDEIAWVDAWSPPQADMDLARQDTGADYLATLPSGFNGEGVRGEVLDGGTLTTHVDFAGLMWHGTTASGSHGTATYGIVFGKGVANPQGLGMLPAAQGIAAQYNDPTVSSNRFLHTSQLNAPPFEAMFQSNSWGSSLTTSYTSISQQMDDIIFSLDVPILQSQSNNGDQLSRPQAWAKNIISVGGIRHYNTLARTDDAWANGASIGPAADGRLKPDISNYYDSTYTTTSSSNTAYTSSFGGTSGATPITAGATGLLLQLWGAGVFGAVPPGPNLFAKRPAATTTKALLINTAEQYAFSGSTHDLARSRQGWGTADVKIAHDLGVAGKVFVVDEATPLAPLQTAVYALTVPAGEPQLKATLVYRDPAGTTSATQHRINNLDLKVTAPDATVYWGNNGLAANNYSTSGGSPNLVDTVENVFVQTPAAGVWVVEVIAAEINQDGWLATTAVDANFSLVVSGVTAPVPAPQPGQPNVAASFFDVNGGLNLSGAPAGFGIGGPFFANATAGGSLSFTFGGTPGLPVVMVGGPLGVNNWVIPGVGSLDVGALGPGNLADVAVLLDGLSGASFFDAFANTGTYGARTLAFTVPTMPAGSLGAFQCAIVDAFGVPHLTAAFEVVIN